MMDASLLATTDGSGSVLWHPSTLQDVYDLPARTLRLYMAFRAGQAEAMSKDTPKPGGTIGGVEVK